MNNPNEDIRTIRAMMEKSSKFLSLHGLSGVIAGTAAILGAAFAYFYLLRDPSMTDYTTRQEMLILLADALVVLAVSIGFGAWLSGRKARKSGQKLFSKLSRHWLYAFALPLVAGGLFCLIYLFRGDLRTVISATLIFYGLALASAAHYTYGEIRWLGITEIALGLAAALTARYGILFWALGFGVCHIAYGLVMYLKYDRRNG